MTKRINASAGGADYDIVIGNSILAGAFRDRRLASFESVAVIVSSRVYSLHRAYIDESIALFGCRSHLMMMDDREEMKGYEHGGRFLEGFLEKRLNRNSLVVGIGGGVTGDFAGFCAGVYMRGIPVLHVPTTLLAMVDSSIGGKSAVNLSAGKNIVGVFRQPVMVAADTLFLGTLPESEMRNGLAEALKHGLIGDAATLDLMEKNDMKTIVRPKTIERLVELSAAFKADVVSRDEREKGVRAILNYGHTVGHAIESYRGYRGISHGMAVAAGILVMVEAGRRRGMLSDSEARRVGAVMETYGLMPGPLDIDVGDVCRHMEYDKKNTGGAINFVMLEGIGKPVYNRELPLGLLQEVMSDVLS
ncbi:MAG: 3-dehydroquinate synthase [Spirochaetes bacterium]|nr:3-dehydroquinate synthase [Spirochaetota bacterium]